MTYSFATLEVSPACWDEVAGLLRRGGYDQVINGHTIDMHGLGLVRGSSTEVSMLDRRLAHQGRGWIGVDLDGTLAHWDHWVAFDWIGTPIPPMVERVRRWLAEGYEVRVLTARLHQSGTRYCRFSARHYSTDDVVAAVQRWCVAHIGQALPVTCAKDDDMIELWDDRAVQVVSNTGRTLAEEHEAERQAQKLSDAP